MCVCHLSHSASATAKTTRDREKSSKQKMFLFALRFILLPGHFPLDPLPCPPEGGKRGRGSPGILPVLQPKRQEIEKSFETKNAPFCVAVYPPPRSFPPRPPPLSPRGGQMGEGVPQKIGYSLCSLPESSDGKKIEIKLVWNLAPRCSAMWRMLWGPQGAGEGLPST